MIRFSHSNEDREAPGAESAEYSGAEGNRDL